MVHTYDGILFSLKQDETSNTCYKVGNEIITLSEIIQSQKKITVWFHLREVLRVVKIKETQSSMVADMKWREERMESYYVMGTDEKSSGDG